MADMLRSCIYCTADLGSNAVIEDQPVGERLAFDEAKGRLWVVCPTCHRWNLVPFDRRLEAIEACERLYRRTATRFATDQIGMARAASGLTLIRVGRPVGEEFASWRYGESFRIRRRRTLLVSAVAGSPFAWLYGQNYAHRLLDGQVSSLLGVAGAGVMIWAAGVTGLQWGKNLTYWYRQRLPVRHPDTDLRLTLRAKDVRKSQLALDGNTPALVVPGSRRTDGQDLRFTGEALQQTLVRVLGKLNVADGKRKDLDEAVKLVVASRRSNPELPTARLVNAPPGTTLNALPVVARLGLEMHANEDAEQQLLAGDLRLLERQWREADALAAIADGLLLPSLDGLSPTGAEPPVALPPDRP